MGRVILLVFIFSFSSVNLSVSTTVLMKFVGDCNLGPFYFLIYVPPVKILAKN